MSNYLIQSNAQSFLKIVGDPEFHNIRSSQWWIQECSKGAEPETWGTEVEANK